MPTEVVGHPALMISKNLIAVAAQLTGKTQAEIMSRNRRKDLAWTRFAIIWALRELNPRIYTLTRLAMIIGVQDHTSILHGYRQACAARDNDELFRNFTDKLLALGKLTDPYRALQFEQHAISGQSSEQIAQRYGISGQRVRKILAAIRANRRIAA